MAEIIENLHGRRMIRVSADDVLSIVKSYQIASTNCNNYEEIRRNLKKTDIYIPEDF